jgi:hypothetical protein
VVNLLRAPVFTASFCALLLCAVPAMAQGPAVTAAKQTMTYEVYAGGINAVRAELNVIENKDDYSLSLAARTKGFLAKLVPWQGTFETHGWRLKDGAERPELHKSTATWRDEEDYKEYYYGKDGSFKKLVVLDPGAAGPVTEEIAPELTQGTTDALTATLEVMKNVAASGSCEGRNEVFDGSRRFALVFRHAAEEVLSATDYNVYSGPAARCVVEVVPVAGKWHEKPRGWMSIQEQGREKGELPTIWMAKVSENGPAVPVKIRVKTDYGTLFMHLVNYDNGNRQITAADGAVEEDGETLLPETETMAAQNKE